MFLVIHIKIVPPGTVKAYISFYKTLCCLRLSLLNTFSFSSSSSSPVPISSFQHLCSFCGKRSLAYCSWLTHVYILSKTVSHATKILSFSKSELNHFSTYTLNPPTPLAFAIIRLFVLPALLSVWNFVGWSEFLRCRRKEERAVLY